MGQLWNGAIVLWAAVGHMGDAGMAGYAQSRCYLKCYS